MAAGRSVKLSLHPQGEVLLFPCINDRVSLASVQTVFPQATGLKHFEQSVWKVVPIANGDFLLPPAVEHFVVVTGLIGQARQIVSGTMASRISQVFQGSSSLGSFPSSFQQPTTSFSHRPRKPFQKKNTDPTAKGNCVNVRRKSYKVVFLKDVKLPTQYSRDLLLMEAVTDFSDTDEEYKIKDNLKKIIQNVYHYEDLKFVMNSMKSLSEARCLPEADWNGQRLKVLVGQGKLYIMLAGYKESMLDKSSSEDSLPEVTGLYDKNVIETHPDTAETHPDTAETHPETAETHPDTAETYTETAETHTDTVETVDTGTPTVTFHLRRERPGRLSLRRRRSVFYEENPIGCNPIEIVDSEDEELTRGIETNTHDSKSPVVRTQYTVPLEQVLKSFQAKAVASSSVTRLLIMRSNILDSAFRAISRQDVNLLSRLYIKFSGELGEDHGGPRREFFRLVMKELHESRFFAGPDRAKYFTHNLELLEKQHYGLVGKLIGLSLAQEGPGPHFFSNEMYNWMVGRKKTVSSNEAESLLPEEINGIVKKLKDADSPEQLDAFLFEHGDFLLDAGMVNIYRTSTDSKETVIQLIYKHYLYYRISGEINQFLSGINQINKLWDLVTDNPDLFEPLFCYDEKKLTGDEIVSLFKINYAERGSNNRRIEEITVYSWELFLQSIEVEDFEVSYSDLLSFITGADHVPPCGFPKPIDILFYDKEGGRLPFVSTCALQLWLPRVDDPDSLTAMLIRAIKESSGFFKV